MQNVSNELKFIEEIDIDTGWEIETDTGFKPISKIYKTVKYEKYILKTNNEVLECADKHIVFDENYNEVFVKDLKPGDKIQVKTGLETVISIENTHIKENMYDITVDDINHRYYTNNILSHNTTTTVCFLLWFVLFHADKRCAILANKGATARQIVGRIELAYMNLPKFIQSGVVDWNKGSFSLENGSSIMSAATSSDSVRGESYSCVFIDECITGDGMITIRDKETQEIKKISLDEFWNLFPDTFCDMSNKKLTSKYEVLTPNGWESFDGIKRTKGKTIKFTFNDETYIETSYNHKFVINDHFIYAEDVQIGTVLSGKTVIKKEVGTEEKYLYDLLNTGKDHTYYCNNVAVSNCAFIPRNQWSEFFKSTYPTISSGKESRLIVVSTFNGQNHFYDMWEDALAGRSLFHPTRVDWWDVPGRDEKWHQDQLRNMSEEDFAQEYGNEPLGSGLTLITSKGFNIMAETKADPIQNSVNSKIYELPIQGHKYMITCDCADTGIDYSTISVIDITCFPYKQVAIYRNNKISHLAFPHVIIQFALKYNNAAVLVESNDVGKVILHILNYDMEYDGVIATRTGSKTQLGQRTTTKTKAVGCARLKDMIESKQLIVTDRYTIEEFKHFIINGTGSSYAAEDGCHDDMVMGLVNFAYFASTPRFRLEYDKNFIDETLSSYEEEMMESLTPLPMFNTKDNPMDGIPKGFLD